MHRDSPVRAVVGELRFAARRLRRDRWAAGGAILAAALGAGLNTAVFAVAYGVLLRPLPYSHPERLVVIDAGVPLASVDEWRKQLTSFDAVSAFTSDNVTVRGTGDPRVAAVAMVDDEFFQVLGRLRSFGATDLPA
jgi:putative ABC transport system permease protein